MLWGFVESLFILDDVSSAHVINMVTLLRSPTHGFGQWTVVSAHYCAGELTLLIVFIIFYFYSYVVVIIFHVSD